MAYYNIQLRRGTTADWTANENNVLNAGEVGVEFLVDGTSRLKVGDGTTPRKNLNYVSGDESIKQFEQFHNYILGTPIYSPTTELLYIANHDFTSTNVFNEGDWYVIGALDVVPTFTPNFQYKQNSIIYDPNKLTLYIAKNDFTSGATFNPVNWYAIGETYTIPVFTANTNYAAFQAINDYSTNTLYLSKGAFTSGTTFDPADWYEIGRTTVGFFKPNYFYYERELIVDNYGHIYAAAQDFTSGGSFDRSDWNEVITRTLIKGFQTNTFYRQDEAVLYYGGIYTATADFTSGNDFDPANWFIAEKAVANEFEAVKLYHIGELIYNPTDSNLYRAKATFTSTSTFDVADWDLVSNLYYLPMVKTDGTTYTSKFFHESDGGGYMFTDITNDTVHFAAGNEIYFKDNSGTGSETRILQFAKADGSYAYGYQSGAEPLPTVSDEDEIVTEKRANVYIFNTQAEFDAGIATVPVNALIVKAWEQDAASVPFGNVTGSPYSQANLSVELNKIGNLTDLDPNIGSASNLVQAINTTYTKAESSVNIKGYLDYGAALLTDMDAIPTVILVNGNTCGVHETQKTYQWNDTTQTWDVVATTGDELGDQYIIESFYGTFKGNTYTGNAGAIITCIQITPTVQYALQVLGGGGGGGGALETAIVLATGTGTIIDTPLYSLTYAYTDNDPDSTIVFTADCKGAGFVTLEAVQVDNVFTVTATTSTSTSETWTLNPAQVQPIFLSLYYMDTNTPADADGINLIYRPFQGSTKAAQIQILPKKIAQLI